MGKLKPNEALRKAIVNIKIFPTKKYGVPPEQAEKNPSSLKNINWIMILTP